MKKLSLALLGLVAVSLPASSSAAIEVDGRSIDVVDMHLHPGAFGQIAPSGKAFNLNFVPPFTRLYAPSIFAAALDPYADNLGVKAQTEFAGVDHAVLYAVYTQKTTGYFTNSQLETALDDPRNTSPDPTPGREHWAWGFASIDFSEGYEEPFERAFRVLALASYFEQRPDLFVGIKLAHAHQAVTFDDERYLDVYDVAAWYGVPVLLHTGFSPFPNSQTDPAYYDPEGLEQVIRHYDGTGFCPQVNFVLSHVGQGDMRSVLHALDLAERYPNVHLEISALNRPFLLDAEGRPTNDPAPQYPFVLAEILRRGLVERTLFGSDGPQSSGMVRDYLSRMVTGMKEAGYTLDEIEAVLSANFYALFRPEGR